MGATHSERKNLSPCTLKVWHSTTRNEKRACEVPAWHGGGRSPRHLLELFVQPLSLVNTIASLCRKPNLRAF
jgi:hypothetical protein